MSDARSAAWLAAWERIEAATKMRPGNPGDVNGQMRMDAKRSLLAEAAIFAELARAPMEVGFAAGEWIEQRAREERENRARFEQILGERTR